MTIGDQILRPGTSDNSQPQDRYFHHFFRAIILDKGKLYEPALASYEKFLAMSDGKNPDEEFKARQRVRIIKKDLSRR
jgi:hypothetical protein